LASDPISYEGHFSGLHSFTCFPECSVKTDTKGKRMQFSSGTGSYGESGKFLSFPKKDLTFYTLLEPSFFLILEIIHKIGIIPNMNKKRAIIHLDLDTFFVSVERLLNRELQDKPLLVGGLGDRGVVAACSYETRRFGVHSGMAMKIARQLCPQAVVIK